MPDLRDPMPEPASPPLALWRRVLLPLVALAVVALDQYTKVLVRRTIPLDHTVSLLPWLAPVLVLTHLDNTGAAWGLLKNSTPVLAAVAAVVIAVIAANYRRIRETSWLLQLALGLQAGGAGGNLVDRVLRGRVTDFVDVHIWPVFNVADSSVVVGTILLAFFALFLDREAPRELPSQAANDADS
ncbi:MAG: signal peptidase II [Chloroflexota bacterium]